MIDGEPGELAFLIDLLHRHIWHFSVCQFFFVSFCDAITRQSTIKCKSTFLGQIYWLQFLERNKKLEKVISRACSEYIAQSYCCHPFQQMQKMKNYYSMHRWHDIATWSSFHGGGVPGHSAVHFWSLSRERAGKIRWHISNLSEVSDISVQPVLIPHYFRVSSRPMHTSASIYAKTNRLA